LSRISFVVFVLVLFPAFAFSLDKPVAPEFQDAAKKRRAEIDRQTFCNEKAAKEKVMKRDLASFVVGCMDGVEKAQQAINK
jgi:hypothetical protein